MNNRDSVTLEQKNNSDMLPIDTTSRPTSAKPMLAVRTKSRLDKQRLQMAHKGYYLAADIAKLNNVSRQYVGRLVNEGKYSTSYAFGKFWLKYDDGQLAKELYKKEANPLSVFNQFGFKQKLRSLVVSQNVVCDIKLLDGISKIAIRFYDEQGNMFQLFSDLSNSELIIEDCVV